MNKNKKIFALFVILTVIAWSLSACVSNPVRKPINNDTNSYRDNNLNMNTPYTAQNNNYNNNNNNRVNDGFQTSSLFSKLDYSYATIIPSSINVRSGPSTDGNIVATLKANDKVKVIGKLNGWYVVNIPNTTKVGCISPNYAKLYSAQPASTEPTATKPIPKTTTPANTGTTQGANTGTKAGADNTDTTAKTPTATGTGTLSSQGSRILQLANAERAKIGAKPLKASTDLNKLASMKSQDIVDNNYFSHQSPTYGSPFDMMKTYGISYMYAGENLAINKDADAAHNAWMNSEGHKKNILNPDFTELGIGLYPKGNGSYAYTQMFIGK